MHPLCNAKGLDQRDHSSHLTDCQIAAAYELQPCAAAADSLCKELCWSFSCDTDTSERVHDANPCVPPTHSATSRHGVSATSPYVNAGRYFSLYKGKAAAGVTSRLSCGQGWWPAVAH